MKIRYCLFVFCALFCVYTISQVSAQFQTTRQGKSRVAKQLAAQVKESNRFERSPLDQFKANHPGARFYGPEFYQPQGANDEAGHATMVYGTVLSNGLTPEASAWNHIAEVQPLLGDDIGALIPEIKPNGEILQGVMYNQDTRTHKFYTLRFNQYCDGVPVFRGGVGFLVRNEDSYPLVTSGFNVKELSGFDGGAANQEAKVSDIMLKNVRGLFDEQPVERSVLKPTKPRDLEVGDAELVVYAGPYNEYVEPKLAVSFIAQRGSVQTLPEYQKYLIVASVSSGEILLAENQIVNWVNVTGNASGRATDGIGSLECHAESAVGLPYAEVSIAGGSTVFADANGNFNIPHGGSSPVTVTSRLRGQWFEVRDQAAGNTIPEISTVVTPPGPANFVHNPAPSQELPNANVNGYFEANLCRDYVLSYEPTFPVIATQTFFDVNTNINSNCNAFYDGSSINFYTAGGGCNNTSFSDVVYHEYGHHLIAVTGNGQGAMGEGTGDVVGVLIQDEPILGHGFSGNCGAGIRNANNTLQYPCSGGGHFCGQLISGCVWDTRNQLIVTEPSNYRDIGAALFLGMLIVRGQLQPGNSTIDPSITVMYLELDDDDGNIGNGTPHYNEIATGFGLHNMDAPPIQLLDFDYPNGRPELISHNGGVAFTVEVLPVSENPQPGTGILYVNRGNGFESFGMNETSPNVYEANFPAMDCGIQVKYYVSAETTIGNTQNDPGTAPNEFFTSLVGSSIETNFADDFEDDTGWSVNSTATDGQWDRGVPIGGGDRGDPPSDGDGSGNCYLTDNEDGNSDVDGGSTTLTSPILDATGAGVPYVSYHRWYSNNFGNAPESDIFVVDISNNGGATWTNLETVGPSGTEVRGGWFHKLFRISDVLQPTNNMRLRFIASDLGDGSVVEAGLDGVEVLRVTCDVDPITPDSFKILDGVLVGGQLSDLTASDDQYFELDPSPTNNLLKQKVDLILQSTSSTSSPNSLKFRLESRMLGGPSGDVIQSVQLLNYNTGDFELVDTRPAANADDIIEIDPGGDVSRFVQNGTDEITANVTWKSESFAGAQFTWSIDIDEAVWLIE